MRTEKTVCDACDRDLTATGNCADWRLALVNQPIPSLGGVVTDMMVYPAIERDRHFCGIRCLKTWMKQDANI